ncbi:hypothetical protein FOA52_004938 [Chlamydomonas sp. UWO 241]|nr:hypothetical protein FOA52_004938 [Chlamydomonas sp. UWO 241]
MLETSVSSVSHLVSRVPGAPMQTQMPHARAPATAAQPARPAAAAAAPVASVAGAPAGERLAAAGTARAAPAGSCAPHRLQAVAAAAQQRHSFVAALFMEDATAFAVCNQKSGEVHDWRRPLDDERAAAVAGAAAITVAIAAGAGASLPVFQAECVVQWLHNCAGDGRCERPAGGRVVSASLLNAKPAVGGIGVVPHRGGVLRVLFTVTSDVAADNVVRYRHRLRSGGRMSNIFDVLSDREEARHQALWPAFVAAKAAGKRAQYHRARLVIDGERVAAPAC